MDTNQSTAAATEEDNNTEYRVTTTILLGVTEAMAIIQPVVDSDAVLDREKAIRVIEILEKVVIAAKFNVSVELDSLDGYMNYISQMRDLKTRLHNSRLNIWRVHCRRGSDDQESIDYVRCKTRPTADEALRALESPANTGHIANVDLFPYYIPIVHKSDNERTFVDDHLSNQEITQVFEAILGASSDYLARGLDNATLAS